MYKKDKVKTWWGDQEVNGLELSLLHDMFDCSTQEGVDVAYMYAKFMAKKTITPDNYPIFLRLFETGNHWVVDALLGKNNPETFFKVIQPNSFIISRCVEILTNMNRGEIYPNLFLVLLGILKTAYEDAKHGLKIFPLTPDDINSIGKHLDENHDQNYPVNRAVLHILDRIAGIADPVIPEDQTLAKTANQANNIRGKFLDQSKKLSEAIPDLLLKVGDYTKNEVAPSEFNK